MTDSVVVEGQVRLRDGKKWKSRWVVFRKPSPVADCLLMLVFKDKSERVKGHKERCSVTLEDICGLDPGLAYEGMSQALAIVCLSQSVILGFDNKDIMHAWDVRLRYSLGEVYRFHVGVLPGTKLECGPATLHICNDILVLARDTPPIVIGQWKLTDLRRYGAVPNGFVFEGGTRCGYWAGVFFLSCAEGDQISFLFDCIVRGISPTKGPFGLRPVLPDPNLNPAYMEERVAHEALEIEKRLSILSYSSRQSSGGDDRSLSSSSSDTSHSDASIGSRLTLWAEPSSAGTSLEGPGPPSSSSSSAKGLQHLAGEEKGGYAEALRPAKQLAKPVRSSRQLQEIGRQSSSDSGIATGSHSSYSGSFSSYTGSLDTCQGEEFGSLLSLPPDQSAGCCTCQQPEYQVPSCGRQQQQQPQPHYDTPRSLLYPAAAYREMQQAKGSDSSATKDHAQAHAGSAKRLAAHTDTKAAPEPAKDSGTHQESTRDTIDETYVDFIPRWPTLKHQGQVSEPKSSEMAPPGAAATADPCEVCSLQLPGIARAPLFAACPVCGGLKGTAAAQPGATAGGAAGHSAEQPGDRHHSEYVNIPVSPTSKKQLHYMELELQEPTLGIRGGGSSKYAQIDIAATETAHKVGSQHAQFREDRLQELEQKKKGAQQ